MVFVLDNYDSFVYNLVQYLGELGEEIRVYRNDEISIDEVKKSEPSHIVISPGPCTPKEAGISVEMVKIFAGHIPILGVCLGHQAIAEAFGGKVIQAENILHGKVSEIYHDGEGLYESIENPFIATRYHSLIVEKATLPDCLQITAWTDKDEIMGIRHMSYPVEGFQFHPESILTRVGKHLIRQFIYRST